MVGEEMSGEIKSGDCDDGWWGSSGERGTGKTWGKREAKNVHMWVQLI